MQEGRTRDCFEPCEIHLVGLGRASDIADHHAEFVVRDRLGPNTDPFGHRLEVWARIRANPQTHEGQQRLHQTHSAALAVGTGDVDDRVGALWVPKRRHQLRSRREGQACYGASSRYDLMIDKRIEMVERLVEFHEG